MCRAILLTCLLGVLFPVQQSHAQQDYFDHLRNRGSLTSARNRIARLAKTNVRTRPTVSPYLRLTASSSRGTNYRRVHQQVMGRRNELAPTRPVVTSPVTSVGTGNRRAPQRQVATMATGAYQARTQAPAFKTGNPSAFMTYGHFYPF